ncbi:energy-coupling factor transporter transmembrane component T family protein [Jeotgalibaca ciconiae]|uniref:Energy-coupling factor transporter transmembrane protein EcfT n=2 Tax=Jeotgalibaca TaxID=1470540 RepID=A0A9D2HZU6_9LACT|nr:energy-coupling factor transporter transmembrane component T [Jeotgalibaca ciconiae]HJA90086.1 energy-coupling factor transporter transmembrane protein EcfT [Candidatus Jeotgalibaca merdavium]
MENSKFLEKISVATIKDQVLKNAYGNSDTIIARLDPRTLFIWYVVFGLIPWFISDVVILTALFVFVAIITKLANTVPLILFVFCIGIFSQTGLLLIFTMLFGGDLSSLYPLLKLTIKIAVVSLAAICAFAGMDPDKLANGLMAIGLPEKFSFSISFAYRILPILMEEYQSILLSYKIRGIRPSMDGIKGKWQNIVYQIKIMMKAFYPLMLNMAKRSRTTVEALEIKGFHQALENEKVRKMKLNNLSFQKLDGAFLLVSFSYFIAVIAISNIYF